MTWFTGVPGLDCHSPLESRDLAALMAALACADRLHPIDWNAGKFNDTPAGKAVNVWLPWLRSGKDDRDAYMRRLALAYACSRPKEDADDKRVLKTAQAIYRWLTAARRDHPPAG